MNVLEPLRNHAYQQPDHKAIVTERTTYSYQSLYHRLLHIKKMLESFQIGVGRVGVLTRDHETMIEMSLGTILSGKVIAPLDRKWTNDQLLGILKKIQLDLLIIDQAFYQPWMEDEVKRIVYRDELLMTKYNEGDGISDVSPQSPFYLSFTSGTTGLPKPFIRDHESWVNSLIRGQSVFRLSRLDRVGIPGPLEHSLNFFALIQTVTVGGTAYIRQGLSPSGWLHWCQEDQLTDLYVVPTMLTMLLSGVQFEPVTSAPDSLKSVIVSGDQLKPADREQFRAWLPSTRLYEFYGASELSFVAYRSPEHAHKAPDSVGVPFSGVSLFISNQQHQRCLDGEVGRVYVKSDMMFSGYLDSPEKNRDHFLGNYFTTGDLGYMEDGYLYIVGRERNMFITGGWNVYPESVETVIRRYPGIDNLAVVGLSHHLWGRIPILVIEQALADSINMKHLRQYCRDHLPIHEVPRRIEVIPTLPLTNSGKLARRQLIDMLEERDGFKI
ncbi:AMP-binding protein [Tuberibacillus sp. Marseille-P3662]|uniref:AMP-binding protein n=1 Tax=Tuberibacillus sp. Marseille-P3662 TaxID=1965358 RepID=UPI000A1C8BB4|nr:AMP-binding protein [Tuberibacillus sp. Marseille-P3662]